MVKPRSWSCWQTPRVSGKTSPFSVHFGADHGGVAAEEDVCAIGIEGCPEVSSLHGSRGDEILDVDLLALVLRFPGGDRHVLVVGEVIDENGLLFGVGEIGCDTGRRPG